MLRSATSPRLRLSLLALLVAWNAYLASAAATASLPAFHTDEDVRFAGGAHQHSVVHTPPPLHVYTLPANLTADLYTLYDKAEWLEPYDVDIFLLEAMQNHSVSANEAELFLIPALPTRFFHRVFKGEGNEKAWQKSASYVQEVLSIIKTMPHWKRCNGCDHFMVIPHDHGRCSHDIFPSNAGELFVIQFLGDLTLVDKPNQRCIVGQTSQCTPDELCYRPDTDIRRQGRPTTLQVCRAPTSVL
jgi:hypothetical protein